ncbi:hypothetical protein [Sinorhizobium meliloti]|uniref:hypothetical protein n=1 Tax=Rhizobium meliloti TaxID=382 RepID=UPI001F2A34E2|nr:hypothetical protein [Sinorhizobium meliloti]
MTTAPPPAHYGAVEGALASGFATAELHHLWGHDPKNFQDDAQQAIAGDQNV